MKKKNKTENVIVDPEQSSKKDNLSRRAAIKRIATILAGAAVGAAGTQVFGKTPNELHLAYLSRAPYNPYVDSVYVPYSSGYIRYSSFYSSYRAYHSIYVPPPYSSRK